MMALQERAGGLENADALLSSVKLKAEADVKPRKLPDLPPTEDSTKEEKEVQKGAEDDFEALAKRFEALKKR
jgi:hypothetical protein